MKVWAHRTKITQARTLTKTFFQFDDFFEGYSGLEIFSIVERLFWGTTTYGIEKLSYVNILLSKPRYSSSKWKDRPIDLRKVRLIQQKVHKGHACFIFWVICFIHNSPLQKIYVLVVQFVLCFDYVSMTDENNLMKISTWGRVGTWKTIHPLLRRPLRERHKSFEKFCNFLSAQEPSKRCNNVISFFLVAISEVLCNQTAQSVAQFL